jgi:O-antigen/teichoic acid export membrane protein
MKNLQEKTKAAVFWSIGGTLLINLFQLLFIGILARSLDATDFGLYTASLVTLSFVRIISEIGIGPAIVQCPQITPRHIQTSVTISLSLSTMAAIILGSSAFIWSAFFHDPKIKEIIILLAFGLPIRGIAVVCESLLIREMRFKAYSTIQFFAYSIGFGVVAITLAHYNFGVWSLAVANLCQVIFVTIAALLLVWRPLGFGFGFGFGLKEGK